MSFKCPSFALLSWQSEPEPEPAQQFLRGSVSSKKESLQLGNTMYNPELVSPDLFPTEV